MKKQDKNKTAPVKITRPRLSGIFPRKRLFRLIDQAQKCPVVWVSAPAGYGKTALLSSYLEERKLPGLWYQVDGRDNDIAAFFYYMGQAAKKATPRKRKSLPLFTQEYHMGLSTFTRAYPLLPALISRPFISAFQNPHCSC